MKLITGLFMAWGNFLVLPCPNKKWDNDLKNYMLGFLPTVGLIIGSIWTGCCILFIWLSTPYLVLSFILTFALFALCGFMHLDGFMDCCDAIMSRKPLEQKQEILKDSHCGAFSVVSVCFMILAYYAFVSTALSGGIDFIDLIMIPVISRSVTALNVILRKPIGHSQYAKGAGAEDKDQKKKAIILILVQLLIFCGLGLFFATYLVPTLFVIGATAISTYLATVFAKRQLGGMSGDIAGYAIVWGELFGILALLIL